MSEKKYLFGGTDGDYVIPANYPWSVKDLIRRHLVDNGYAGLVYGCIVNHDPACRCELDNLMKCPREWGDMKPYDCSPYKKCAPTRIYECSHCERKLSAEDVDEQYSCRFCGKETENQRI